MEMTRNIWKQLKMAGSGNDNYDENDTDDGKEKNGMAVSQF